ncbi:MAG: acyl-CoA dehydrogenase family protein [Deltaproteobacteria bacterium]|nr:acyl-CoA dehydrogenase family protein [Deltaproteobacteria bacterium]
MITFEIGAEAGAQLERARELGRRYLRPLGIEADRKREPVPPEHPFFLLAWQQGIGQPIGVEEPRAAGGPRTAARRGVLLAEEMSYWDRGMSVALPGLGLGGPPLLSMGTPEQKERFLAPFRDTTRPHWAAFGMTEPGAGSDVAGIQTSAVRDGDAWILNGAKTFISNSMRAEWIVVWATIDKSLGRAGHRAFIVERGTPGLEDLRYEHKMGLIAYESSSFTLRDCRVPALHLLGGEAHYAGRAGFKGAMKSFNATRPAIAVMAIGIARAAYDAARDFARQHYRLDRPIPRYQRYREKLARMARKIEVGRLLCWRAAWLADAEQPNEVEASMAKAFCPQIAQEATSLAVEILGDAGVASEHYVEKLYRDVKAMDIVEGTGQIQRIVMARRLVGLPH